MITVYRGNTRRMTFKIRDQGGAPFDLTGGTVSLMVKADINDADGSAVITKTATLLSQATNPGEGYFDLTAADTTQTVADYVIDFTFVVGANTTRITPTLQVFKVEKPVDDV